MLLFELTIVPLAFNTAILALSMGTFVLVGIVAVGVYAAYKDVGDELAVKQDNIRLLLALELAEESRIEEKKKTDNFRKSAAKQLKAEKETVKILTAARSVTVAGTDEPTDV